MTDVHVASYTPTQLAASRVRAKLRNPPNAVPDDGIDLKRPKTIPIASLDVAQDVPVTVVPQTVHPDVSSIERQVLNLVKCMNRIEAGRYFQLVSSKRPQYPASKLIIGAVAMHFGVTVFDLISDRRQQPLTYYRQIAIYLCRELTPLSLTSIGRVVGNRDHSTVFHAIKKIAALRLTDEGLNQHIETLLSALTIPPEVA